MKGLFNLDGLDSKNNDELLSANICESGVEFGSNSPASNPEVDFDKDATSGKETNIPVPGGDKETPTAKPEGGEKEIPVPGGDKETPTAKPYDAASIPVPSKVVLTADQYNNAISNLKKSFKEGVELMEMLEGVQIVDKTLDERQKEYTESVLDMALLESYESGPYFESVTRSDKTAIKKIVGTLRSKVDNYLKDNKIPFYKPVLMLRVIFNTQAEIHQIWTNRLWQVVGIMNCSSADAKDLSDKMTEEFKEILGEYKIIPVKSIPTLTDLFKTKFNWKNNKGAFLLIVDTKLPADIKAAQQDIADEMKDKEDKKEDKKEEK